MPLALSALGGRLGARHLLLLAVVHAWLLYLGSSLAFGAIAFNEAFPLDVALIPVSAIGLARALRRLGTPGPPRWLPEFLFACGLVTCVAWALLLWLEMASGAYPPAGYYTVRTTFALDLGIIAPGCLESAIALRKR